MSEYERPRTDYSPQSRAIEYVNTTFIRGVFMWMTLGLAFTATTAWMTLNTPALGQLVFGNQMVFFGLIIAQVGMVLVISSMIQRLSGLMATMLFLVYSGLNGITLSVLAVVYTNQSLTQAFISAAATFAAMSVYGYTTKRDLTSIGSFAMMALIGIIIASLLNIFFFKSDGMQMLISIAGVLIFVALTAYDVQKIRQMGESVPLNDSTAVQRGTILGALTLYLDFINLFIFMLRILGNRRS